MPTTQSVCGRRNNKQIQMKKIYICGDSFGCPELGWEFDPWPVLLSKQLGKEYTVNNLSISCSSNLLIRIQVDQAIADQADFVILLCTASTRNQGTVKQLKNKNHRLYDRFVRIGQTDSSNHTRDLACYSIKSLDDTCVFAPDDINSIKNYQTRLFDLDLAIYENQCIIESSLNALQQSNIPFVYDQGGFENPMFGDVKKTDYFLKFNQYMSEINQWSLTKTLPISTRAHFHITDHNVHKTIADYFYKKITTAGQIISVK